MSEIPDKNIGARCASQISYRKTLVKFLEEVEVSLSTITPRYELLLMVQVNADMTDSVGPGKLVGHMQNLSYAYDGLSPSYASVHVIALGTSFDMYKSQNSKRICLAGLSLYIYLSAEKYQTVRTECCLAERNSAHVLV